ncbi:MAG: 2-C-methyl-D-erythritol 4-phosphate cytidylyltransferase [Bacteroidaceae bacterium]|nr:2-C-methyl-D-erythritol 4-phosphate cytidylyltransferase [Bacteroidaceae bacterium]
MQLAKAVIIVAGGKGLRMGTDIPKQFLPLEGTPILMHTIRRFYDYDHDICIIIVLPKDQLSYWQRLCKENGFGIPHHVTSGGEERFHSVRNGLSLVPDSAELIAVHDGVRPYVTREVIARCFEAAAETGAAIPVTDIVETIRHITPDGSHTVPRSEYKIVQTPQVFSAELLRRAYLQPFMPSFTDDASVVESLHHPITLVAGNRENIKITTKVDI